MNRCAEIARGGENMPLPGPCDTGRTRPNTVPRHAEPEPFRVAAYAELQAAPPWVRGVCFNPGCSARFEPRRDWQMYCGTACERAGTAELRKWGHKLALPALVWRMGKYERHDADLRALARAGRRYVGAVQSAWLADRGARVAGAVGGNGA